MTQVSPEYKTWPRVVDLCAVAPSNGLMEKRGSALIDMDRTALQNRMRTYFDPNVYWDELTKMNSGLTKNAAGYKAKTARTKVLAAEKFLEQRLQRYTIRPFDNQWCYYSPVPPLWNRARPSLWAQVWEGNGFFVSRLRSSSDTEGAPSYFVSGLSDDHLIMPDASCFPLRIKKQSSGSQKKAATASLFFSDDEANDEKVIANLSSGATTYLTSLGLNDLDGNGETAGIVWMHALAITYTPAYLSQNADAVQQDWPRIPLPVSKKQLLESAGLGRVIASLLNTDQHVPGVTSGTLRKELSSVGVIERCGGGTLHTHDLDLTAGWGHRGKGSVTSPGKGRVVNRKYSEDERQALKQGVSELGLSFPEALGRLGRSTYDIYLNDVALWTNVPSAVWGYRIGGYQVTKKWLSYRERPLLGRGLTVEEAEYVTEIARRIAAVLLLGSALDANYVAAKMAPYCWD